MQARAIRGKRVQTRSSRVNDFITFALFKQDYQKTTAFFYNINKMAPMKKEKPEMSAFERKRLENIAANSALLKDLSTTAEKIIPRPAPKPRKTSTPRKKTTPVKREAARPVRTSSRLAGVEADSETAKRKAEVEETFAKETQRAKKQRITGDINLSDAVSEGKKWSKGDDFLSGIMRGAVPNLRTFGEDDIKETTDEGLKALREKMSGLELYEGYEPNRKSTLRHSVHANPKPCHQRSKSPPNGYIPLGFILRKTNL